MVIGVGLQTNNNSVLNTNLNKMSENGTDVGSSDYRSMLKRTNIDPGHSVKVESDDGKPVYDFRKLLRRTGRLDFIEQKQ